MKTQFQIRGYIAFSELDDFKQGCIGQSFSEHISPRDWSITSDTLGGLVDQLKDEFNIENDSDFMLNCCDEDGRLDAQVMQKRPFNTSKIQAGTFAAWRLGQTKLYLTNYLFKVEQLIINLDLETLAGGRGFST